MESLAAPHREIDHFSNSLFKFTKALSLWPRDDDGSRFFKINGHFESVTLVSQKPRLLTHNVFRFLPGAPSYYDEEIIRAWKVSTLLEHFLLRTGM